MPSKHLDPSSACPCGAAQPSCPRDLQTRDFGAKRSLGSNDCLAHTGECARDASMFRRACCHSVGSAVGGLFRLRERGSLLRLWCRGSGSSGLRARLPLDAHVKSQGQCCGLAARTRGLSPVKRRWARVRAGARKPKARTGPRCWPGQRRAAAYHTPRSASARAHAFVPGAWRDRRRDDGRSVGRAPVAVASGDGGGFGGSAFRRRTTPAVAAHSSQCFADEKEAPPAVCRRRCHRRGSAHSAASGLDLRGSRRARRGGYTRDNRRAGR